MFQLIQTLLHQLIPISDDEVIIHIVAVAPVEFFHRTDAWMVCKSPVPFCDPFGFGFCKIMVDTDNVRMVYKIVHSVYALSVFVDGEFSRLISGKMY